MTWLDIAQWVAILYLAVRNDAVRRRARILDLRTRSLARAVEVLADDRERDVLAVVDPPRVLPIVGAGPERN